MNNIGRVVALNGDRAEVEILRVAACGGKCNSCGGCETKLMTVSVLNDLGAKLDDKVELVSSDREIIGITFMLYILPLFMFLLGFSLVYVILALSGIKAKEFLSFLAGVLLMGLTYLFIKKIDNKFHKKNQAILKISAIINDGK